MVVSPGGNILWTCDPESIEQFCKRNQDFVKPVDMMGMLNLYGPTVTATEGNESRRYRKIAAPSFNDRTHGSVWHESLSYSLSLVKRWESLDAPIKQLHADVAQLTLQVISVVCFDRRVALPSPIESNVKLGRGHTLTYSKAISSMVANIPTLFIVPPAILGKMLHPSRIYPSLIRHLGFSPFSTHKKAVESYVEWQKYMEQMRDETSASLQINGVRKDSSLLGGRDCVGI
ncbi:MAG: hypothetical protein Q9222_006200 [Ikaeria aurantiellina]